MRNKVCFLLCLFLTVPCSVLFAENGHKFVYRIGVLAMYSVNDTRTEWVHLGYYLKDKVPNADFEIVPMDFRNLEKAVGANELDFILTNPAQYIDLNERFGIEPIATREIHYGFGKASVSGGVAFTRVNNKEVDSWASLKGKKFVTVNERSFGAWLSIWRELKARGIQPLRDFSSLRFLGSPERVVLAVLNGQADAGSVDSGELERLAEDGKIDLKEIRVIHDESSYALNEDEIKAFHSTSLYPEWPMARTQHASEELAKRVAVALFEMDSDDLAAVSGGYAGWTIPSSYASVLASLREIGYGPFRNYGKVNEREILRIYRWRIIGFVVILFLVWGFALYVFYLNRRLLRFTKKLEEEIRAKIKVEAELRRNEAALKNMITNLAETQDSLQAVRDQLLQSDKLAALGQLAAGVAHELNNPLGFIANNISVLREYWDKIGDILSLYAGLSQVLDGGSSDEVGRALQAIDMKSAQHDMDYVMQDAKNIYTESLEGVERMRRIIQDLKTFAREDRSVRFNEDVCQVMEGILGIVYNEIKYKADLIKEYEPGLPLVFCNKQQIGQVFINILLNAVQSIEKHGRICIRIYQDGGMVKIDIEDTGIGIPEQNLKKVFEPFFSTKDVGRGTGLGLSISYDIVQKHGGTLSVKSEVGKGSTFTVALPFPGNS